MLPKNKQAIHKSMLLIAVASNLFHLSKNVLYVSCLIIDNIELNHNEISV